MRPAVFVAATPGPYELTASGGVVVEQIIRPTGLIDPPIEVRPVRGQVDDLLAEIRARVGAGRARPGDDADQADGRGPDAVLPGAGRAGALPALATSTRSSGSRSCATCGAATSTCSSASTCCARGSTCRRCRSWPSSTPTRKASCARPGRSIQTIGRAARNVNGRVIMYADKVTDSMSAPSSETDGAARVQEAYNEEHGITPTSHRQGHRRRADRASYERDYLTVPDSRQTPGRVPDRGRARGLRRPARAGDERGRRQPRLRAGRDPARPDRDPRSPGWRWRLGRRRPERAASWHGVLRLIRGWVKSACSRCRSTCGWPSPRRAAR